jgi:Flavin-binding monooxygenase-like
VLVVGAGNSACDVAVESARIAGKVCLSMRSPQWFFPKFIFGTPSDAFAALTPVWVPARVRQTAVKWLMRALQGPYSRYGLPQNTRPPFSDHPTLNSDLFDFIRHGRIKPRPGVRRLLGEEVEFTDGSREAFDILCTATGYSIDFPFFDKAFIDYSSAGRVPLYRKMMHPLHANLYFIGLIQPLGCIWPLADYQARLACLEILGRYKRPADMEQAILREIAHPHVDYQSGLRHSVEVDYRRYRQEMREDLRGAGVDIGKPPAGRKDRYKIASPPAAVAARSR